MKFKFTLLLKIAFCFSLFSQVNLNQGLIAYYNFDNNVNGISGNSNNGNIFAIWMGNDGLGEFYIDCVLDDIIGTIPNMTQNNDIVTIGRQDLYAGIYQYGEFNGSIDDLRVYNRVLSDDEIAILCSGNIVNTQAPTNKEQAIKTYPSLVTNHFTIQSQSPIQNIQVLDAIGNQIFFQEEGSFQEIETDGWQCGIYFVLIQTEAGLVTKKVVKQ